MSKIELDKDSETSWKEVKDNSKEMSGAVIYFENKSDFHQFSKLVSEMDKEIGEDFFKDRLLSIGKIKPFEAENGELYNCYETKYFPDGKNGEEAFITTDEKGELLHLVGLTISDVIGSSDKLIELSNSGEEKLTEYEKEFLTMVHQEVGYSRSNEKDNKGLIL